MVRAWQAPSTAGSSRAGWRGEKEQLIKLSKGLIKGAEGSDSRGRRFKCSRNRRMGG